MKLIVLATFILLVASTVWFTHRKAVEDQKKKSEICLNEYLEDFKNIRVGLDNKLNQQELDKVNANFQACLKG